jgi:hypothetical protein
MDLRFYRNVVLKALALLLILNLVLVALPPSKPAEQFSLYNHVYPGRDRFPFGETPQQAYNFSLYDVDAMFASHEVSKGTRQTDLARIFVYGDSSVWGTLLKPQETLVGQLNKLNLTCRKQSLRFYNLGYPTISVTKDLMLMERSLAYQPDMVLWLTTLEALPLDKQLASPLAANNTALIAPLVRKYQLGLEIPQEQSNWWSKNLWSQRRVYADWLRLQLYGVMWAATGVDQIYPAFTPAAWDLEPEENYYDFQPPAIPSDQLLYSAYPTGMTLLGDIPLLLVNEPIMISGGQNSDMRYNFFYPRWAYDQYRETMKAISSDHKIEYVDAWDWIPPQEFTNSAIHMNAESEAHFAEKLSAEILKQICP